MPPPRLGSCRGARARLARASVQRSSAPQRTAGRCCITSRPAVLLACAATGPWGVWAALVTAGALGLWCEKNTKLGRELSGALVATLLGMAMANLGVLPSHPPELNVVYKFILPLAIPMLLFSADLARILKETGRLLSAFLLGSATTVVGSAVAMLLFPLSPYLGDAGWRIASALTARHIGGAVNYMAVSDMLDIPASATSAGLAADDLILTFYFTTIYTLARNIPPDSAPETAAAAAGEPAGTSAPQAAAAEAPAAGAGATGGGGGQGHGGAPRSMQVLEGLLALSLSALICHAATSLARAIGYPGQTLTMLTGLTVALATLAPRVLAPLVPSAEALAQVLMQVFYATIGASANVALVIKTAPVLFLFSAIALATHLGVLLLLGRALGFSRKELLIASNANIGGPSTVAGMCAAKGWTSSIVPGLLTSTLGYAIGTFIGMALGRNFLCRL